MLSDCTASSALHLLVLVLALVLVTLLSFLTHICVSGHHNKDSAVVVFFFLVTSLGGERKKDNRIYMCYIYNIKSYYSPVLVLFLPRETEKNERRGLSKAGA
jgi:hypothetical protein